MTTLRAVSVVCLASLSAGAFAVQRGTSQGEWWTGDFSAPESASRWGYGDSNGAHNVISVDEKQPRDGRATMRLETNSGFDNWVFFPNTKDIDLDLSQAKALRGFLRSENKNGWGGDPWVIFVDMAGNKARFDGQRHRLRDALKDWSEIVVLVGADLDAKCTEHGWKAVCDPAFDWKRVACVQIHQDTDRYGFII